MTVIALFLVMPHLSLKFQANRALWHCIVFHLDFKIIRVGLKY